MTTNHLTIWQGSREFLTTTVLDESTTPAATLTSYDVAILPLGAPVSGAVWSSVKSYAGTLGTWAEPTLLPVTYVIFARIGAGSPNEQSIVALGVFSVRSR